RRVVAADTPSGPLSEWTQEKLGIAPARLQVVPFGANVELFRPGDAKTARSLLGLDSDVQVVGYTGALSSIRHVDLLIEAFSRLVSERGKESLRLLLVGDGAERAERELLAKRLGVGDCVRFAGTVRYEHVPRLLQ